MTTRFPIIVITLFVFLREARPLECYVCTKCPVDPSSDQSVQTEKDCPACVIEDKFIYKNYLQTDRSCAQCPDKRLEMSNNNKSYYHCCKENLCLGLQRVALLEKAHPEYTGVKPKKPIVEKVPEETDENHGSRSVGEVQSTRPRTETETPDTESASTAADRTSILNTAPPMQPSDAAITPTETTTANSHIQSKSEEITPESRGKGGIQSASSLVENKTQDLESSSSTNVRTGIRNTSSPKQPPDDTINPNEDNQAKSAKVEKVEENTLESQSGVEVHSTKSLAETENQDMVSRNIAKDHTNVIKTATPKQSSDTDNMPAETTNSNTPIAAKPDEKTPKSPSKTDEHSVGTTMKTTTQDMESSSPASCHITVWYLAFSTSMICGLLACFN